MKDVLVDLRAARRRLESGSDIRHGLSGAAPVVPVVPVVPAVKDEPRRPVGLIAGAVVGVLLFAAILYLALRPPPKQPTASDTTSGKPSIAVFYFDNVKRGAASASGALLHQR